MEGKHISLIMRDRDKERDENRILAMMEALASKLTKEQILTLMEQPEEVQIAAIIAAVNSKYLSD